MFLKILLHLGDLLLVLKSFANEVMFYLKKSKHLFNNGKPILVLEPGRAIVDECMQLVSKITSKKKKPIHVIKNI